MGANNEMSNTVINFIEQTKETLSNCGEQLKHNWTSI